MKRPELSLLAIWGYKKLHPATQNRALTRIWPYGGTEPDLVLPVFREWEVNICCVSHRVYQSVQSPSRVWLFASPQTAACQKPLSINNPQSSLKLMSNESVIPSLRNFVKIELRDHVFSLSIWKFLTLKFNLKQISRSSDLM